MEWISIKDSLPKKDGKYLCVWKGRTANHIEILNFSQILQENKGRGFYTCDSEVSYSLYTVTHWMPLPELPKED